MASQLALDLTPNLPRDAYVYGTRTSGEVHGVVLTKPHIVELILDLAGYTPDRDLGGLSLLEPSCGHGAFLIPAVKRLLDSAQAHNRRPANLVHAVLAFDIDPYHVERTRHELLEVLLKHGVKSASARRLVKAWVRDGDFLLSKIDKQFEFIVGNPPYVRIEQLSTAIQAEYRARYRSVYDRADLYVAFIERGLTLLSPTGKLSFICADRWVSNKYGAPLRELITTKYKLHCYIDLHKTSPFESEVIAYPSIFLLSHGKTKDVSVLTMETASPDECCVARMGLTGDEAAKGSARVATYANWFEGEEPWVLSSPEQFRTLRELEARFAPIETTARVGIGVATGNDKVYIVGGDADIERDRLVPLVMRDDVDHGKIKNANRFVINTFDADGRVVNLVSYLD